MHIPHTDKIAKYGAHFAGRMVEAMIATGALFATVWLFDEALIARDHHKRRKGKK